jgi:hypothetical protein
MKNAQQHRYEIVLAVPNASSTTSTGTVALEKVTLTVCATGEVSQSDMAELESRLSRLFKTGKPLSATSMEVRKLSKTTSRNI